MAETEVKIVRRCKVCTYAVTGKRRKNGILYRHGPSTLDCNSTEYVETVYEVKEVRS